MYTQCPDCNTIFRVSDEQLQIAGGKVRCGHCMAVFQAREHEVSELPSAAPPLPPPPPRETEKEAPLASAPPSPPEPEPEPETAPPPADTAPEPETADETRAGVEAHPALDEADKAGPDDTLMEFDLDDLLAGEETTRQEPGLESPLDELDLAEPDRQAAPGDGDGDDGTESAPEPEIEAEAPAAEADEAEADAASAQAPAAENAPDKFDEFDLDEFDLADPYATPESVTAEATPEAESPEPPPTKEAAPEPAAPAWNGDALGEAEIESLLHTEGEPPEPEAAQAPAPEPAEAPGPDEPAAESEAPVEMIDLADEAETARFDETLREVEALNARESASPAPAVEKAAEAPAMEAGPETIEPAPARARRRGGLFGTLVWSLLILALLGALLLQYAYINRDTLAAYPQLRPWLTRMCSVAQCSIPPRRDLKAIEIIERQIQTHPRYKNALLISATLVNQAPFAQPFPRVEVVLEDVNGRVVASRIFKPAEYLVETGEKKFAPHAQAHLQLQVADPSRKAVSFEFKFY